MITFKITTFSSHKLFNTSPSPSPALAPSRLVFCFIFMQLVSILQLNSYVKMITCIASYIPYSVFFMHGLRKFQV